MKSTKDLLKHPDGTSLVIPMEDGHFLLIEAVTYVEDDPDTYGGKIQKVIMLPSHWDEPPVPTESYWS